jgi:hypothetical protein
MGPQEQKWAKKANLGGGLLFIGLCHEETCSKIPVYLGIHRGHENLN